jgi:threonine dehydratase
MWSEANELAKKIATEPNTSLIHPFDDPEVDLL